MKLLIVIPARGGSKGIPGKNIKALGGIPLIHYSIKIAKELSNTPEDICVSTDDLEIKRVAEDAGIQVPFLRPKELATDQASSREVILHALEFYEKMGKQYDVVLLLQPTSPFRRIHDLKEMVKLYSAALDMVVSVTESPYNPYFSLFEEGADTFLRLSKPSTYTRRQDAPKAYAYNGSAYLINPDSIKELEFSQFKKIKKYVMDEIMSIDIDTPLDWKVAEVILESGLLTVRGALS